MDQKERALGSAGHLSVRIRIWLAPLLQAEEAGAVLREARALAQSAGFGQLLEEINQLEQELPPV